MGNIVKKALKPVSKVVNTVVGGILGAPDSPDVPDAPASAANADEAAKKAADEKLAAENEAAAQANSAMAERTRQRRTGSLLASAGSGGNAQTSSVLAYGKGRLGE